MALTNEQEAKVAVLLAAYDKAQTIADLPEAADRAGAYVEITDADGESRKYPFDNIKDGLSAYDIAVENGFEGTEQEWLESLQAKTEDYTEEEITALFKNTFDTE